MPDQDILREIKKVVEVTSRMDTRLDKFVNQISELDRRVTKIESDIKDKNKILIWKDWIDWVGDWVFKLTWIIIAAYILARLGQGGVHLPTPF